MMNYEYFTLQNSDIRLLNLLPGSFNDPLTGNLTTHQLNLDVNTNQNYEAISYVWGDQSKPSSIEILDDNAVPVGTRLKDASSSDNNTLSSLGHIKIGPNLASALRHFRHDDQPRVLWCDSICINQQDLQEKSAQVRRMGAIYRNAHRVVVWLGLASDDSGLAMKLLADIASQVEIDDAFIHYKFTTRADPRYTEQGGISYSSAELSAIRSLISRTWFKRLWVRQEILLARSNAIVVAGHDFLLWASLIKGVVYFNNHDQYQSLDTAQRKSLTSEIHTNNVLQLARTGRHVGLLSLLRLTRACECHDDRDRVYALLGLLPQEVRSGLEPDYAADLIRVCKMAMLGCMYWVGLGMLSLCDDSSSPSWVPDLCRLRDGTLFSLMTFCIASCRSPAELVVLDEERVRASAVQCGVLSGSSWMMPMDCADDDLLEILRKVTVTYFGESLENSQGRRLEILTETLTCGRSIERTDIDHYPSLSQYRHVLQQWAPHGDESTDTQREYEQCQVLWLLRKVLPGRSIHVLENGSVGIGPGSCKAGDLVAVVLGCEVPLVLRHSGGVGYRILGQFYSADLCDGQAILGELPPGWKIKFKKGTSVRIFQKEDGLCQWDDPRVAALALPAGWSQNRDSDGQPVWHRDAEGSKSTYQDPRVTSEMLRKRGVRVEHMILV